MTAYSVKYERCFLHMKYVPLHKCSVVGNKNWVSNNADGAPADGFIFPMRHTERSDFHKKAFELAGLFLNSSRFKNICVTHSPQFVNLTSAPQRHSLSRI